MHRECTSLGKSIFLDPWASRAYSLGGISHFLDYLFWPICYLGWTGYLVKVKWQCHKFFTKYRCLSIKANKRQHISEGFRGIFRWCRNTHLDPWKQMRMEIQICPDFSRLMFKPETVQSSAKVSFHWQIDRMCALMHDIIMLMQQIKKCALT